MLILLLVNSKLKNILIDLLTYYFTYIILESVF